MEILSAPKRVRNLLIQMTMLLMALVVLGMAASPPAGAASPYGYEGAGVVVHQDGAGNTRVDHGLVACAMSEDVGWGGFCIPFQDIAAAGSTLTVTDDLVGLNVSYQVCLDNNGNNICGDGSGACADQIWFSHAGTVFANPMSGLPTASAPGCPGSVDFEGLVVLVCRGVHDTHPENSSRGAGVLGSGVGMLGFTEPGPPEPFCGGAPVSVSKAYLAAPEWPATTPAASPAVLAAGAAGLLATSSMLVRRRRGVAKA